MADSVNGGYRCNGGTLEIYGSCKLKHLSGLENEYLGEITTLFFDRCRFTPRANEFLSGFLPELPINQVEIRNTRISSQFLEVVPTNTLELSINKCKAMLWRPTLRSFGALNSLERVSFTNTKVPVWTANQLKKIVPTNCIIDTSNVVPRPSLYGTAGTKRAREQNGRQDRPSPPPAPRKARRANGVANGQGHRVRLWEQGGDADLNLEGPG